MSQYESSPAPTVSTWAIGGITFAGTLLILIGMFSVIDGIAAIANDGIFVSTTNYTFDLDTTAWGWIHLLLGILLVLAGWSIFAGKTWAAVVALTLAMLSAIANFFFIPYYPFWSILMIALNCWVIWSLTRPGVVRTNP